MRSLAAIACLALVCACRNERHPRDASQPSRLVTAPAPHLVTAPAPERPPEVRRAVFEARDLTDWAEAAPGVRWRKATVHVTGVLPVVARAEPPPDALMWVVVRVDVSRAKLTVERSPHDSITELWERERDAVALVDAGYFEPDRRPSGLVMSGGVLVAPVGPRGGSGVLCATGDRIDVVPLDARDGGTFAPAADVSLAVQCGPRIIEAGGAPGIYRHDGRYAARTAACVRDRGRTLDLVAAWEARDGLRGPELHDFATLLAGPSPVGDETGCELALNLDGGPSTGVYVRHVRGRGGFRHEPLGPTPWGLVVRARR